MRDNPIVRDVRRMCDRYFAEGCAVRCQERWYRARMMIATPFAVRGVAVAAVVTCLDMTSTARV